MKDDWVEFSHKPHQEVVANFILNAGCDCLTEHLNRIGKLSNRLFSVFNVDSMTEQYLLVCLNVYTILNRIEEIFASCTGWPGISYPKRKIFFL